MIYMIGGAPRAGKSRIASAVLRAGGIPYLNVDYIKMAFARSMPDLGVDPSGDNARTARLLWPFVEAMIMTMIENGQSYTLEAIYILPSHVEALQTSHGDAVRACFVGFELADTDDKVREIEAHRGEGDDWLRDADRDQLVGFVERAKAESSSLRLQCEKLGLQYFETSSNFQRTIDAAAAHLLEGWSESP